MQTVTEQLNEKITCSPMRDTLLPHFPRRQSHHSVS